MDLPSTDNAALLHRAWTRRRFTQALAASAAIPLAVSKAAAFSADSHVKAATAKGLAFVGCLSEQPHRGRIEVFRVSGPEWQRMESVEAASPAHLVAHPVLPVLYVVHDVAQWRHLPRGAVSAYQLDTATGQLLLGNTQPLSLSAVHPQHAAVTADARHLVVAARGGGAYNVLPLDRDGNLLPVNVVRKEVCPTTYHTGKSPSPCQVLLNPRNHTLLTTDPGQESVTSFRLEPDALLAQHRRRVHPGSGAAQIALSSCGRWLYALSADKSAIAVHDLDAEFSSPLQVELLPDTGGGSLALHPSGSLLLLAGSLSATLFSLDQASGRLRLVDRRTLPMPLESLVPLGPDEFAGLHATTGQIASITVDTTRGRLSGLTILADAKGACSLLFRDRDA